MSPSIHIPRKISDLIAERLHNSDKIVIIYGPRQVGKTTLVNRILESYEGKVLRIDADQQSFSDILSSQDLGKMRMLVEGYDLMFIDEAQRIPNVGINLKILHDNLPELKIIATGSSSFELANKITEPLTGRTWTYNLYPIAFSEWSDLTNPIQLDQRLDEFLQFGMYPEIFSFPNSNEKREYLMNVSRAYLYKDILDLGGIRHADKIKDLLRLLAYQMGSLVSFNEISKSLKMSVETVQNYVDLLEKTFVIFRLRGFSRNLRKEIIKNHKIYFVDLGIRNAIIENFLPPDQRPDKGAMWENFLIQERMKTMIYQRQYANRYFWRTYTGAELDYVEESDGKLHGYEFKWGKKGAKAPKTWLATYSEADFQFVNRENYLEFLLEQ